MQESFWVSQKIACYTVMLSFFVGYLVDSLFGELVKEGVREGEQDGGMAGDNDLAIVLNHLVQADD